MSFSKRLKSKLQRWAIPNPTSYLIAGQALFYLLSHMGNNEMGGFDLTKIMLLPGKVMEGEVWRLFSFIFFPPGERPIFVIFVWLLTYRFGTALEAVWGTYRFNLFLLIAFLSTLAAHFVLWAFGGDNAILLTQFFVANLSKGSVDSTAFVYGTLFLAFSRLFPDYVIQLMFILPIRIRWLALITWIAYGYVFIRGPWQVKVIIFASLLNYFIFLGRDHLREIKQGQRRRTFQAKVAKAAHPSHTCRVCGVNSDTSPKMAFRYCSKCAGQCCYCPEHIQNHEHVVEVETIEQ
jgi:hypothetical protein